MEPFEALLAQLDQLDKILEELIDLGQQELTAVRMGNLTAVDAIMRREQALSLSIRGLDQKRERLLRELGLQGVTISGLPARAPEKYALRTRQTVERVLKRFEVCQQTRQVVKTTLECDLHLIEKHMREAGQNPTPPSGRTAADIRA